MIDLLSDTVPPPSEAMRRAMADAEVGDDVLGEDPTVNELQRLTAELLGKEAALYVPSGTMANQLAVRAQVQAGDEVLLEAEAHVYAKEAGAIAAISGATCRTIAGTHGIFTADDLAAALRPADLHHARSRLVCVENTHNAGGGTVWPLKTLTSLAEAAHERGLAVHMDGARLWNAAVASGVAEADFAAVCDTVAVCFSKGLGAPIGSALAGSAEVISRARHLRKMLGGGMRQAGIVAAGALYALRHNRQRLAEDHANARALASGLAEIKGLELTGAEVTTNIIRFRSPGREAADVARELLKRGVRIMVTGRDSYRAVTHLMITRQDSQAAVEAMTDAVASVRWG
jgi:threonine aldolase